MQITVNGKEYKIEFTFEAAESDTVQKVFEFMSGAYVLKGVKDSGTELEKKAAQVDVMIEGLSSMPRLAIDLFHMGLLEYHGQFGDGSVKSRDDAKLLYKQFCKENPESELATQYGLFEALKVQMEDDGFFKRIGLTAFAEEIEKSVPTPQDHKKKKK